MNEKVEVLTPYVNTDVKIPRKLFDALTLHEVSCCMRNINSVSQDDVRAFLSDRFNNEMALLFKPEYLLKSPSV